jgi:hypothetical protein
MGFPDNLRWTPMSRLLKLLKLFILGLRRHPLRFVLSVFLTYSAIWTILESSSYLFPSLKPQGWIAILVMIFVSVCVGIYRVFPQQDTQLRIKSIDTTIEVAFGDLFESSGLKIIPVNEFFDSELGDPVSPRSLHGRLIKRLFGSHPASFDTLVEEELEGEPHSWVNRTRGKEKQYPIGTTPLIKVNDEGFFLPALCHTDLRTFKASCDIPTLWRRWPGCGPPFETELEVNLFRCRLSEEV